MLEPLQGKQKGTVSSMVVGEVVGKRISILKARDSGAGDGRLWSGLIQGRQGQILRETLDFWPGSFV